MAKIPVFVQNFDHEKFAEYLQQNGATILDATNAYEVLRYQRPGAGKIVIYRTKNGALTWPPLALEDYRAFKSNIALHKVTRAGGDFRQKLISEALERDGDRCCFCGEPLNGDITLEHWLSIAHGGNNRPANTSLAHEACNQLAGNLPIIGKILLRERLHAEAAKLAVLDNYVIDSKALCELVGGLHG